MGGVIGGLLAVLAIIAMVSSFRVHLDCIAITMETKHEYKHFMYFMDNINTFNYY